jgi:thiol-disulfide isomerase/thioredoxin
MMKKLLLTCLLMCSLVCFAQAPSLTLKPYQKGDWKSLAKSYTGQALIVHFWGVTCSPCVKEMPEWGKFLSQHKNAKIIFIQVDDVSPESASKMLLSANLGSANAYMLTSPFDDAMRYEIDPKWRGETPMTLLIDKKGKVIRKTGTMDFEKLQQWLSIAG